MTRPWEDAIPVLELDSIGFIESPKLVMSDVLFRLLMGGLFDQTSSSAPPKSGHDE
jgi:hypothetical protein